MEHKEQVRIAVSKALARILGSVNFNENSHFLLIEALILLLNDEQPDIRYYLCECDALVSLIDHKQSGKWNVMQEPVKLNDQVVVELLFEDLTQARLAGNPEELKQYTVEFLFKKWIIGNPYRDHLAKNYEDKIFFFEPVNKFYDLLWVKKLSFKQLQIILTAKPDLKQYLHVDPAPSNVQNRLTEYYAAKNILRHNAIELENLAQDIMVMRLLEPTTAI